MITRSSYWSTAAAAAIVCLLVAATAGAVPPSLTHQGRLLGEGGQPMTGEVTLEFAIYDAETGGSVLWESRPKTVDLGDSGFYSVKLGGEENPIDRSQLAGDGLWIGLSVDGGEELSPRIELRSVPYALRAGTAETVADGAVDADAIADGAVDWGAVENKPATLGDLQCADDQIAAWNGMEWVCRDDSGRNYSAGGGIDLNSGTIQLSQQSCGAGQTAVGIDTNGLLICRADANTTYDKNCPSGQVVGRLGPNGAVTCVSDSNTTYSAGAGLVQSGTSFELEDQTCGGGEAATGINNGNLQCTSVGDIDAVTAGNGLSGGGQSGTVSLSADFNEVQRRVNGSCSNGKAMVAIDQSGSVSCETVGSSADPSSVSSGCGDFRIAQVCPVGKNDGPSCGSVSVGAYCEADTCGSLDGGLNNCGSFDWYFKTGT